MLDVYKSFYKLTDIPFRLSPDHRFSFGHHSYVEAKAYLEYAIFQGEGFITVTGRPGTGKTTLIGEILSEVDKSRILVAMINSTQLDARDLLHMVAASFGLQFGEVNKVTLLLAIEHFLIQQNQKGLRSVLIVDEAQGLSLSALEELRLLANLQYEHQLLLQVCLVGQEQLRNVIAAPDMDHFRQRLIAAAHLNTLDLDETITYIEHRLCCAGWRGDPALTEEALRRIYQSSGGIPRIINLICNRMFLYGGLEEKHELSGEDAEHMINELQEEMLLAPDGAIETIGTGAPGHETDKVIRSLPRGEMLTIDESYSQPRPIQPPVERPAAVKAGVSGGVSTFMPPETGSRTQPDEVTAPSPPAQAPAVTGEPSLPSPEETPDKPKGSRLKIVAQVIITLLLATSFAFMLIMALQQNWFALLKHGPDIQDEVRREATPGVNQPRTKVLPETGDAQETLDGKPEVAQSSSKLQPNRDASRQDIGASAILVPEAERPDDTIEPGLQIPPADAAPKIAAQPPVAKQVATVDKPQVAVVKKVTTADKPKTAVVKNAPPADKPQAAVAKKVAPLDKSKTAVVRNVAPVDKPQVAVAKKIAPLGKPQTTVEKNVAPVDKPQAAVAKKIVPADKPQTAVVKNVAAVNEPQAAIEAKRLPLKNGTGQRVERLTKPPGQSLAEAAKPAAPARLKTSVVSATAGPLQPSARLTKPAFAADDIKTALLAGRWNRDGQPASVLPSEVTFCSGNQQVINCWSVPQSSESREGEVAFKVESSLSGFTDTGGFRMLDRRLVRPIGADATNDERWHVTEQEMKCEMVKPDSVFCRDRYGNTNEYQLSALSR